MKNTALPNVTGPVFGLTSDFIKAGLAASRESERQRMILPLHRTQDAKVQRMINFLQPETYIRPHLHPLDHAVESVILLQGALRFLIFDDSGSVLEIFELNAGSGNNLVDIEPGVWHSFAVLKPDTIVFEVKCGPYNAETDKRFAIWSPEESSHEAAGFVRFMKNAVKHESK